MLQLAAAAAVTLLVAPSGIPPAHLAELDVYHVNPPSFSDTPLDMNTGDDAGDMFFNLQSTFVPILCRNRSSPLAASFTCKNAEINGADLVVTKLRLAVDRRFGQYQLCNICVDGHDPLASLPPPPPPPPPGTPPSLRCQTRYRWNQRAPSLANCTGPPGSYCYKLRTSNTTMLQGCDNGALCAKFTEPTGQCFGMPNPATGVPIDIICSAPGNDSLTPLSPSDFDNCPLINSSNRRQHPLYRNCTSGEYLCDCPAGHCKANEVGAQNISSHFGSGSVAVKVSEEQMKALDEAGIEVIDPRMPAHAWCFNTPHHHSLAFLLDHTYVLALCACVRACVRSGGGCPVEHEQLVCGARREARRDVVLHYPRRDVFLLLLLLLLLRQLLAVQLEAARDCEARDEGLL
jgi:hypothetical protein